VSFKRQRLGQTFSGDDYRPTKGERIMAIYKVFPVHIILMRRTFAVLAGILALPVMMFWKDRARFYSYLHRVWAKTSEKPVWMDQAEKATCDFY
jgi:hypothetical protein